MVLVMICAVCTEFVMVLVHDCAFCTECCVVLVICRLIVPNLAWYWSCVYVQNLSLYLFMNVSYVQNVALYMLYIGVLTEFGVVLVIFLGLFFLYA